MDFPRTVVLEPRPEFWWERNGVFNPAVIEMNGRISLLYRALGADHISRFGLAVSTDGESFDRLDQPVFEADERNPLERLGVEDPRATRIGSDILITYTAASVYPASHAIKGARSLNTPGVPWRIRVALAKTRDLQHFDRLGTIINDLDSKDAFFFPKKIRNQFWLIHRVDGKIYLANSNNFRQFSGGLQIAAPHQPWEMEKIGGCAPPFETEQGWLLFYHGVDAHAVYRVGVMLLAKENPAVVLKRSRQPLLEPHFDWEKRGQVSNVVFPTGYVVKNGSFWLYYGAADKVVGLAKISLDNVLAQINE